MFVRTNVISRLGTGELGARSKLFRSLPSFKRVGSQMPLSQAAENCQVLHERFEGREAIYIEKGALLVRVSDISARVDTAEVYARVEEIPTQGLECGLFHSRNPGTQGRLRWQIGAGVLTTWSAETWTMGYGGWSLFFAPRVVSGIKALASHWPSEVDAVERYKQVIKYLTAQRAYEPSTRVFPA